MVTAPNLFRGPALTEIYDMHSFGTASGAATATAKYPPARRKIG